MIDTEDCSRGPLSGCIRLADSSRVIQRLKVSQNISVQVKDWNGHGPGDLQSVTVRSSQTETAFIK